MGEYCGREGLPCAQALARSESCPSLKLTASIGGWKTLGVARLQAVQAFRVGAVATRPIDREGQ